MRAPGRGLAGSLNFGGARAHTSHMSVVLVTCDRCGEVRVSARKVVVYPDAGEIRLDCPVCRRRMVREVDDEQVRELCEIGAEVRKVRAVITYDDILDFAVNFEDEMKELLG